ncbi:MAG TPA: hypothetical protein VHZ49_22490 [Methylomirabilota bacterium]|jgi:hypothetical protein|nr:hypothetical protein [Methylomirabilota bacterium]
MTGQESRIEVIRQRILSGLLPRPRAVVVYAGYSAGRICDACGERIEPREMEHELAGPDRPVFMHPECFRLWQTIEI